MCRGQVQTDITQHNTLVIQLSHLSLCQEVGHECAPHCVLQLTVFEDEERRFPSKLQGHLLHPLSRHFHDLSANRKHTGTTETLYSSYMLHTMLLQTGSTRHYWNTLLLQFYTFTIFPSFHLFPLISSKFMGMLDIVVGREVVWTPMFSSVNLTLC